MDEHDDEQTECMCVGCQLKRQMVEIQGQLDTRGAANCRRELWLKTFHARIKLGSIPGDAGRFAARAVVEFDKAFPEVKSAAMAEDR